MPARGSVLHSLFVGFFGEVSGIGEAPPTKVGYQPPLDVGDGMMEDDAPSTGFTPRMATPSPSSHRYATTEDLVGNIGLCL
ncbi:hypothetical protein DFH06DRAFT_1322583 [Mycena polygramma]|nr:hypothetical protein DFH06DRAFT_1322583 [Mycena polygramma]